MKSVYKITDFLKDLKNCSHYSWCINKEAIGIRARCGDKYMCPITAVYYNKVGRYRRISDYYSCGITLGLTDSQIIEIQTIADRNPDTSDPLYIKLVETISDYR